MSSSTKSSRRSGPFCSVRQLFRAARWIAPRKRAKSREKQSMSLPAVEEGMPCQ